MIWLLLFLLAPFIRGIIGLVLKGFLAILIIAFLCNRYPDLRHDVLNGLDWLDQRTTQLLKEADDRPR